MTDENSKQADSIVRAMTDDGSFRVMTLRSTQMVQGVADAQDASGALAEQLGEVLSAAVLVRETMAPGYRVQVAVRDANERQLFGDAMSEGRTRGLVTSEDGKPLELGPGALFQSVRQLPRKEPHTGIVEANGDGGIAEALQTYFLQSEQVESMVALGCVVDGDTIRAAGGFVVQLLPELTDPPLQAMRETLASFGALAPWLAANDADPHRLMHELLPEMKFTQLAESKVMFECPCDASRALGALATLGEQELLELLEEEGGPPIVCHYCGARYEVTSEDIMRLLDRPE